MPAKRDANLRFLRGLVIVPAFNEAATIAQVVEEVRQAAPRLDIVVIDDGSTDGTAARVPAPARVLRLPFNLGIGGAMQTGYRFAAEQGHQVAIQVDGDGQHPAGEIPALLARLDAGDADLVIGSRFLRSGAGAGDGDGYRQTRSRAAGSGILRHLLRLLTGRTFTDCTSGFRAANRRVIEAFAHHYPDDYPEPEVVLLLQRAGFQIAEVPVAMRHRSAGRSSISLLRGIYYVIKVAVALLLATARKPWPQPAGPEAA